MNQAFICDAVRTPFGRFGGALATMRADDLAALPLKALLARNPGLDPSRIDDVIFGCANQAGEDNRNVARMALLLAGLPESVPGSTINRLCGSSLDAIGVAARAIKSGETQLMIAGGVESMSRAPFVMGKAESAFSRSMQMEDTTIGWRFINPQMKALYGVHSMPETAENVADEFAISRADQDAFALRSQLRTAAAQEAGRFADELIEQIGALLFHRLANGLRQLLLILRLAPFVQQQPLEHAQRSIQPRRSFRHNQLGQSVFQPAFEHLFQNELPRLDAGAVFQRRHALLAHRGGEQFAGTVFFCAQARDGFIRRLAQLRHHPRRKQRVAEHLGAEQFRIEHLANGARDAAALFGDQPGRKRHAPAENPLFFVRPQKHPHGDIVCNVTDQRACGGTNQPAPVKASHVSESPPSAKYLTYFDHCIAFHLFCQARQDSACGGRKL